MIRLHCRRCGPLSTSMMSAMPCFGGGISAPALRYYDLRRFWLAASADCRRAPPRKQARRSSEAAGALRPVRRRARRSADAAPAGQAAALPAMLRSMRFSPRRAFSAVAAYLALPTPRPRLTGVAGRIAATLRRRPADGAGGPARPTPMPEYSLLEPPATRAFWALCQDFRAGGRLMAFERHLLNSTAIARIFARGAGDSAELSSVERLRQLEGIALMSVARRISARQSQPLLAADFLSMMFSRREWLPDFPIAPPMNAANRASARRHQPPRAG